MTQEVINQFNVGPALDGKKWQELRDLLKHYLEVLTST